MTEHAHDRPLWARGGELFALVFVGVCVWLFASVHTMRESVEQRVGSISIFTSLEAGLTDATPTVTAEDRSDLTAFLGSSETSGLSRPLEQLARVLDAVETGSATPEQIALGVEACRTAVSALRDELGTLSIRLGDRWTVLYIQLAVACLGAIYAAWLLGRERKLVRRLEQSQFALDLARAEAEEASAAKTTLLASVSHDLRTPLNAILGFSGILLRNEGSQFDEAQLDLLQRVRRSGHQLLHLVNSMLDLSAIESGRLTIDRKPVELDELVRDCVSLFEPRTAELGLELEVVSPAAQLPLVTDGAKLGQMLLNLVGNAVKYTRRGSVRVEVIVARDGGPVRIDVVDTGVGIPAEHLDEMFEAFRQLETSTSIQHDGAGLGLSITRSLGELLGFPLEARSVPGEGSTFSIVLDPRGATNDVAETRAVGDGR